MDNFEKKLNRQQKKNFKTNNEYWLNGMWHRTCPDSLKIKVFGSICEYNQFNKFAVKKLTNEANRNGVSKRKVIENILISELYRNSFAPNAGRQRVHEKNQDEIIRNMISELRKEYKNISISIRQDNEKGYKYVITSDGNIKSLRFEEKDIINDSKLFDVIIDIVDKNYTFHRIYMSLKYTKENGGMQDNVRTEIIDTYKYCLKNNDENTIFMFMLDGDYWNSNKNGELITNTNKIYRVNSKTFKNTISEIIKNF